MQIKKSNELFKAIIKAHSSVRCLKLPTIDKKSGFIPAGTVSIDIMICLPPDVKGGSIVNLRAIKPKILEKRSPNRRRFRHPSIFNAYYFTIYNNLCASLREALHCVPTEKINTVAKIFPEKYAKY